VSRVDWAEALTTSRTTVLAVLVPRGSQRKHSHRAGQGGAGQGRAEQKIKNQKKKTDGDGMAAYVGHLTSPPTEASSSFIHSIDKARQGTPPAVHLRLTHSCAVCAYGAWHTHTHHLSNLHCHALARAADRRSPCTSGGIVVASSVVRKPRPMQRFKTYQVRARALPLRAGFENKRRKKNR
jgi:hypothetical protein